MELITRYIIRTYTPKSDVPWPENMLNPMQKRKNDFWITKEGEIIYPADMDDKHLVNTIKMIHRSREKLRNFFKTNSYFDEIIIYGPNGITYKQMKQYNKSVNKRYKQMWNLERQYMRLRQEAIA